MVDFVTREFPNYATQPVTDADLLAAQEELNGSEQRFQEQRLADIQGSFWSQLGLREAGKAAENALMFLGEWQRTINKAEEALAQGISPPPDVTNSLSLYETRDNEDRWDAFGKIFNGETGG